MLNKISFKQINALAIPALIGGIVEPLISLTDTAIAGRLGEEADLAIGAIGLVGAFLSAAFWIFAQSANAIASKVAVGFGKSQLKILQPLVAQTVVIQAFVGVLLSLFAFLLGGFILSFYGAQGELKTIALQYFKIRVWGIPFTLVTYVLIGIFKGLQNTSWAMKISVIGGIINLLLSVFFALILEWGVQGIAWASVIAQGIMCFSAMFFLYQRTPFKINWYLKLHPELLRVMKMSLDLVIRTSTINIVLFLGFRFATAYDGGEGAVITATHAILGQIWLFSAFLLDGYAHAGLALSGRLLGLKDFKELNRLFYQLIKISLFIGVVLSMIYLIFQPYIGRLLTNNYPVLQLFGTTFIWVIFMQPINAIAFLLDGFFKGLGETVWLRNWFVLAMILGFLPALFLADSFGWELHAIWFAFTIWMIFRAAGLWVYFIKKYAIKKH